MYVFGSQYLRGLTPRRQDWSRDMAAMREAGFNTIRGWLVWNAVEPEPGRVDFEYLSRFMDLADENHLKVGLLFHLHGCPEWAVAAHPECFYVSRRGIPFEPSQRTNTPSGGWPGLCYDWPQAQELERSFISRVAGYLAGHPALAFWEPMNEPHMFTDGADGGLEYYCYCQKTREAFRNWLQGRYGSLAELDEAWGMRHSSWHDVRPPTWRYGYKNYVDWRYFISDNIVTELTRRIAAIRESDPVTPVIAHSWGGGSVTCGQLPAMAFDDWKNAKLFDMWGYSAFPGSLASTPAVGLGTDATRSAAAGKTFWQAELGTGDLGSGLARSGRADSRLVAIWTWESIRHGAKGVLYWQYRKEAHGAEMGAYGLTDYAGRATPTLDAVSDINRIIAENEELFGDTRVADPEVAIVFSIQSYHVDWCDNRNCNLSVDSMNGYYRMFWEENIPVDIVHEDEVTAARLARYKLVVLPMPVAPSRNLCAALEEYVAQGGTLLSDPYFGAYDENLALSEAVPGRGFDRVFGCGELDIFRPASDGEAIIPLPANGQTADDTGKTLDTTFTIKSSRFKEVFLPATGRALATYGSIPRDIMAQAGIRSAMGADASGEDSARIPAAVVANDFGKGKAIISGLNLGLGYASEGGLGDVIVRSERADYTPSSKELVMHLISGMDMRRPVKTPSGIYGSLLPGVNQKDSLLIIINGSEVGRSAEIEVAAGPFAAAQNLGNHEQLPVRSCGGNTLVSVALGALEAVAIRLSPGDRLGARNAS